VITSSDTVLSIFNSWCDSWNAIPFWSDQWKLAAIPIDPAKTGYPVESATIRERFREDIERPSLDTSRAETFTDLSINSVLDTDRNALVETRRVANRTGSIVVTGPDLDMLHGESKLQEV